MLHNNILSYRHVLIFLRIVTFLLYYSFLIFLLYILRPKTLYFFLHGNKFTWHCSCMLYICSTISGYEWTSEWVACDKSIVCFSDRRCGQNLNNSGKILNRSSIRVSYHQDRQKIRRRHPII